MPGRRQLLWLSVSIAVWAFVLVHLRGPWFTVFDDGDHWSHFSYALLFLDHGFGVYDRTARDYCAGPWTPEVERFVAQGSCRPADVCVLPGHPSLRPLCVNWQQFPQPYPPGLLLYSLPEALLYAHTGISFSSLCLVSLLKYLVAAHLLVWLLWRMLFAPPREDDLPGGAEWEPLNPWLRAGLFGLLYLATIGWALDGFYDPLSVFFVFLGVWLLLRRRGLASLLALSASLLLHYRALWYAPLFLLAARRAVANREWRDGWRAAAKLAVAAAFVALAAAGFLLIRPWLARFPQVNPIFYPKLGVRQPASWNLGVPLLIAFAYLAWGRCWTLLSVLSWQIFTILQTPQTMTWHALFLLPNLAIARGERTRGAMAAAVVFHVALALTAFNWDASKALLGLPLPGLFLSNLVEHWGPIHG